MTVNAENLDLIDKYTKKQKGNGETQGPIFSLHTHLVQEVIAHNAGILLQVVCVIIWMEDAGSCL